MGRPKSLGQAAQFGRAIFWRSLKKLGVVPSHDTIDDQGKDRIAPFDEYPACEMCGSTGATETLIARDGNRIVECDSCGLWFTNPRIAEPVWTAYLKEVTDRSIEFTENRLRHGVALSSNVKYAFPDWRERIARRENATIDAVERHLGKEVERLHDVGCGVGDLLRSARERGIEATGNELNAYACQVMRERLGLTVYNESLPDLDLEPGSLDAVVMHDYIEHTYHPRKDFEAAYRLLRPGGILYVTTFHVDCRAFDTLGRDWHMLYWNHTIHFSTGTLSEMVERSGFELIEVRTSYDDVLITLVARR